MIRSMSHSSLAIANEFLRRAQDEGVLLTNMHVQKLVYIAHGWNLAVCNEPLIDEPFLAWDYGPVAHSLYQALRRYGSGSVPRLLRRGDDTPSFGDDDGEAVSATLSVDETRVIKQIWDEFKGYKAFQLSELTHKSDSPWSKSFKKGKNTPIPNLSIQDYFSVLADQP
jgi:uncharacterized phage-associated protein